MIWNSSYTPYEPPMPRFSHPSDLQRSSESWSPRATSFWMRSETKPEKTTLIHGEVMHFPQTRNGWKHHGNSKLLISSHDSPWIVVAFFWGVQNCWSFMIFLHLLYRGHWLAQGSLWQHRDSTVTSRFSRRWSFRQLHAWRLQLVHLSWHAANLGRVCRRGSWTSLSAMENCPFIDDVPLKIVICHLYIYIYMYIYI